MEQGGSALSTFRVGCQEAVEQREGPAHCQGIVGAYIGHGGYLCVPVRQQDIISQDWNFLIHRHVCLKEPCHGPWSISSPLQPSESAHTVVCRLHMSCLSAFRQNM